MKHLWECPANANLMNQMAEEIEKEIGEHTQIYTDTSGNTEGDADTHNAIKKK